MFVFPPPPPRLTAGPYGTINVPGQPPIIIETSNTLEHPEGPDYSFSVGEGVYKLREDIYLATPPPHPSEIQIVNPNPLATTPVVPSKGTKISLVTISHKPGATPHATLPRNFKSMDGNESHISGETGDMEDGSEATGSGSMSRSSEVGGFSKPIELFGRGNAALQASMDVKKKKAKNNIAKSNSAFVSRLVQHEQLQVRMAKKNEEDYYLFANINRAFNWLDMTNVKKHEPNSKILFAKAHPLCHDVNDVTKSSSHLDVIIGFSTGDIMWFDPISNKYARINKNGQINSHPVTEVRWLPGSESLFLAAHHDGSIVVYDKDKEDAVFVAEDDGELSRVNSNNAGFSLKKSVTSVNHKTNPVAYWSVSKQPINAFAFSPDNVHLAVVSEDGCLRIIDYVKEKLLDVYNSYYGGLLCVCWSPDGRYILTGGQDDLVSIWSFSDRRIVARCEGHHSWVTGVAFDPWRCDERTYRFGSVGEDCRLLLWDFSVGMLHRPKTISPHRGSVSSGAPNPSIAGRLRSGTQTSSGTVNSHHMAQSHASLVGTMEAAIPTNSPNRNDPAIHPVDPRARTAVLPPIMSKVVDPDPLASLLFREDSIVITCNDGHIRTWDRPGVDSANAAL